MVIQVKKNKVKKEKKEMSDKTRVILFSLVIVVVIALIGVSAYFILKEKSEPSELDGPKTNVLTIEGYGITLDDLDSDVYKSEFEILKKNLESGNIDYDAYAESVAKMFIIDLYTIKSKINKYDVGGVELVLTEGKENFITNVTDTIYNYVEDNSNGKRNQKLPVVSEVKITNTEKKDYKIESLKKSYEAYVFKMDIIYSNDYGYDKTAEVTVVKKDNFMYVVEKN